MDHMKRCHNHVSAGKVEPTDTTEMSSKTSINQGKGQAGTPSAGRKRSAAKDAQGQTGKRQCFSMESNQKSHGIDRALVIPSNFPEEDEASALRNEWRERYTRFRQRALNLEGPDDLDGHFQLLDDVQAMHKISEQLRSV